jgi:hypothetical protein
MHEDSGCGIAQLAWVGTAGSSSIWVARKQQTNSVKERRWQVDLPRGTWKIPPLLIVKSVSWFSETVTGPWRTKKKKWTLPEFLTRLKPLGGSTI